MDMTTKIWKFSRYNSNQIKTQIHSKSHKSPNHLEIVKRRKTKRTTRIRRKPRIKKSKKITKEQKTKRKKNPLPNSQNNKLKSHSKVKNKAKF